VVDLINKGCRYAVDIDLAEFDALAKRVALLESKIRK
jgi:hypothetical protein